MCSRAAARNTLISVNVLFFIIGLAMVGMGAYALSDANTLGNELAPVAMLRLLIATGTLVTITSFLGCCGAAKNGRGCWRYVLLAYALSVLVVIVLQFVAVAFLFMWQNRLETIKGEDVHRGDTHGDESQWENSFDQAANRTYTTCCVENEPSKLCHWVDKHSSVGCGGSYAEFRHDLIDAIESRLRVLNIITFAFGIVEVICLVIACSLFWKRPRDAVAEGESGYGAARGAPVA